VPGAIKQQWALDLNLNFQQFALVERAPASRAQTRGEGRAMAVIPEPGAWAFRRGASRAGPHRATIR